MRPLFTRFLVFLSIAACAVLAIAACTRVEETPAPDWFKAYQAPSLSVEVDSASRQGIIQIDQFKQVLTQATLSFTPGRHGQVTWSADRQAFMYKAAPDFPGRDSLTYRLCNGGSCKGNSIQVRITNLRCTLIARPDTLQLAANTQGMIDVLANDTHCGGLLTSAEAAHGTVDILNGTTLRYRPNPAYFGRDSIRYTLCAFGNGCVTSQVHIQVSNPCTAKIYPRDDIFTGVRSQTIYRWPIADFLANDSTCSGQIVPSTFHIISYTAIGQGYVDTTSSPLEYIYYRQPQSAYTDTCVYRICNSANNCGTARILLRMP